MLCIQPLVSSPTILISRPVVGKLPPWGHFPELEFFPKRYQPIGKKCTKIKLKTPKYSILKSFSIKIKISLEEVCVQIPC